MAAISNDWLEPLTPEFRKPYYAKLYKTVLTEYNSRQIFSTHITDFQQRTGFWISLCKQ